MNDKEIELLEKQLRKLDEPAFDFASWKSTTQMILDRIFGKNSEKTEQLKLISIDYSSWTLRDTSGLSPMLTARKKGAEILKTAIEELRLFPSPQLSPAAEPSVVQQSIEEVLRVSQYRELAAILQQTDDLADRKNKISDFLNNLGPHTVRDLLIAILSRTVIH